MAWQSNKHYFKPSFDGKDSVDIFNSPLHGNFSLHNTAAALKLKQDLM